MEFDELSVPSEICDLRSGPGMCDDSSCVGVYGTDTNLRNVLSKKWARCRCRGSLATLCQRINSRAYVERTTAEANRTHEGRQSAACRRGDVERVDARLLARLDGTYGLREKRRASDSTISTERRERREVNAPSRTGVSCRSWLDGWQGSYRTRSGECVSELFLVWRRGVRVDDFDLDGAAGACPGSLPVE